MKWNLKKVSWLNVIILHEVKLDRSYIPDDIHHIFAYFYQVI